MSKKPREIRLIQYAGKLGFRKLLSIAAQADIPVLLSGETGSGKEVAARYLHSAGPRSAGAFVPINCGALPTTLVESLLCGHRRGAFTGAVEDCKGLVFAADGGTLFLDEVAELPPDAQVRLLRILQEKAIVPIGDTQEIPVDFRLICATHRDLAEAVAAKQFREDLYHRIALLPVRIPPLRCRLGELPELVSQLWKHPRPLDAEEMQILAKHPWPGNIRELRNVLECYALLRDHGVALRSVIKESALGRPPVKKLEVPPKPQLRYRRTPSMERIQNALFECCGNKSFAAHRLGISRGCLDYQLKRIADL
jgi:transcriptional regulator with PAS, ATPase and Fis domain